MVLRALKEALLVSAGLLFEDQTLEFGNMEEGLRDMNELMFGVQYQSEHAIQTTF